MTEFSRRDPHRFPGEMPYVPGVQLRRGRLDAILTPSGTADVSLQKWDGSGWIATGRKANSARVGLPIIEDLAAGTVVWVFKAFGQWFVLLAECSEE